MKKWEVLEHKADLKIKVFGKTKKSLLENAMLAMFEAGNYEFEKGSPERKIKIKIRSIDFPSLLVDFLSEVLYLVETKKLVFQKSDFKRVTEREIEGFLIGKNLKRMGVYIKGVTYHELEVKKENNFWKAQILFDI